MPATVAASWLWPFLGAALAIGCEYLYRTLPGTWFGYIWLWVPLQTAVGYMVYRMVTAPGISLVDAFIYWTFATVALRLFVSVVLLGDPIKSGTWVALALVVLARVAQTTLGK